jgi:hypothetical protein
MPEDDLKVEFTQPELRDYFRYRSRRDVIRPKTGAPETPAEDPSTQFVDRQLQKALENVRAQVQERSKVVSQK